MSFTYPQQPMPPYGGEGAPSVSPQGWQSVPPPQPAPPLVSPQPQLPPVTPHEKGDMEGMALLTVVIIFHILFNIYWLHADTHLIHLDEAHHIGRAAAYYDALFPIEKTGLFERGVAALNVESPYPPLTHLVGAVFIRVLGYSPDSIAFSGSLFLGLFLIGVYLFARQGVSARNAFLAALLAGFMPMTFASSRYFMPDLLLAALVAWALYALLKSDRFRKTSWVVLFALFAGLAFLTKQIAFVYLLFPVLWIFLWGSFSAVYPARGDGVPLKRSRAAQLLFNMLLCIFIVLGVCSWWYTRHVEYMYTWWSTQRGGEIGLLQPGIASHIKFAMPENGEDAESSIYLDPAISRLTVKIKDETTDTKEVAAPEETTAQNLIPITPEKETSSLLVSVTPEGEMGNLLAPIAPEGESAKTLEGETETEDGETTTGSQISEGETVIDTPRDPATEGEEIAEEAAANDETASAEGEENTSPRTSLIDPLRQDWEIYPLYFVNEIAFLPIALLALLGLPALFLKRNRNAMALLLLVWAGGAYLLLTGIFTLHSPQLLYAASPPAAVLCVMALNAIPRYRLRRVLWGVLFFFLVLQYVNLTLFSFGPVSRFELPILREHPAVKEQQNCGVTVYKDHISVGHYLLHPPQRGEVVTEMLFEKMLDYETNRKHPVGPVAWYQVISETPAHLSLDFYARHYQRIPLPLESDDAEGEAKTVRPFSAVKWESRSPEGTLPELAETEYVILKQDLKNDDITQLEEWAAFFSQHGFESISNNTFDSYGMSSAGYIHLMARREIPSLENNPDIFQSYELLMQDGASWLLTAEERTAAEQRYARLLQEYTHIQSLDEKVNLLGFHVKSTPENWHVLRLIVQATDVIIGELKISLRATVHPDDREKLPESYQEQDTFIWDFTPQPAAATWKPNQALVLSRPVMIAPLRYKLEIGVYEAGETAPEAGTVKTDWIDFGTPH